MKYLVFLLISVTAFCQKPCGFKKGLQEGTCKFYYENGNMKELSTWKEGKTDGKFISYDENGNMTATGSFKRSFKVGKWSYYKNGKLDSEENYVYKNNLSKLDGDNTFYYPSGVVEEKGKYKDGKPVGKWEYFNKEGKLEVSSIYVDGKREGNKTFYNSDGSVKKVEVYKNGQLINTKK